MELTLCQALSKYITLYPHNNLRGRCYHYHYYFPGTDEKTDTEKLSDLFKVIYLAGCRTGTQNQAVWFIQPCS